MTVTRPSDKSGHERSRSATACCSAFASSCGRCAARTREIGSLSDATIGIIESWVPRSGQPVWSNLKRSLANLVKQDIGQLTALVKTRLRRMQYRPGLLEGFLAKPGLDLGNFHN